MEYGAPKEVLPIDSSKDDDTPYFQFIFFLVNFWYLQHL